MNTAVKLTQANIPFRTEDAYSNQFHGTRHIFSSRANAMKAEKVLGTSVLRYYKEWAVTIY